MAVLKFAGKVLLATLVIFLGSMFAPSWASASDFPQPGAPQGGYCPNGWVYLTHQESVDGWSGVSLYNTDNEYAKVLSHFGVPNGIVGEVSYTHVSCARNYEKVVVAANIGGVIRGKACLLSHRHAIGQYNIDDSVVWYSDTHSGGSCP